MLYSRLVWLLVWVAGLLLSTAGSWRVPQQKTEPHTRPQIPAGEPDIRGYHDLLLRADIDDYLGDDYDGAFIEADPDGCLLRVVTLGKDNAGRQRYLPVEYAGEPERLASVVLGTVRYDDQVYYIRISIMPNPDESVDSFWIFRGKLEDGINADYDDIMQCTLTGTSFYEDAQGDRLDTKKGAVSIVIRQGRCSGLDIIYTTKRYINAKTAHYNKIQEQEKQERAKRNEF